MFFFFNPKYEWLDWVIIYIDLEKDDSRNKGKGRSMAKNTKKKKNQSRSVPDTEYSSPLARLFP